MFLASAAAKFARLESFRVALIGYYVLRGRRNLRRILSLFVPALEILVGLVLISGLGGGFAALLAAVPLLAALTFAIVENAIRGITTACGCGIGSGTTGFVAVIRNLTLLAHNERVDCTDRHGRFL